MAGHTPGPWSASNGALIRVVKSDRGRPTVICGVHKQGRFGGKTDGGCPVANARLIAAAPDLYEACKAFMRAQSAPRDNDTEIALWDEAIVAIEAAIAKAEGQ